MTKENIVYLADRLKPRPEIGPWRIESVSLAQLPSVIVAIAETLAACGHKNNHRQFALLVLAACSNALYQEG